VSYIVTFGLVKISRVHCFFLRWQNSPVSTSSHNGILCGIAVVELSIPRTLGPLLSYLFVLKLGKTSRRDTDSFVPSAETLAAWRKY
jgi:hypothetical protein